MPRASLGRRENLLQSPGHRPGGQAQGTARPRASSSSGRDQGQCADGYDLLASVYCWFTEGFNTPDFKQAMALLDASGAEFILLPGVSHFAPLQRPEKFNSVMRAFLRKLPS